MVENRIKDLMIINIPPGFAKSMIGCVCMPPWRQRQFLPAMAQKLRMEGPWMPIGQPREAVERFNKFVE